MKATLIFEGKRLLSKQNSYLACGKRRFKNPKYVAAQSEFIVEAFKQLKKQKWKCTDCPVAMNIMFYGPVMSVDWDNCGILTDSFQGKTETFNGKKYRLPGVVVFDDRQFHPVTVDWTESEERKIVVELETKDEVAK